MGIDKSVLNFFVDALRMCSDLQWEEEGLIKRKKFVDNMKNKNPSTTPALQGQQPDQEQQTGTTPDLPTTRAAEAQPSPTPVSLLCQFLSQCRLGERNEGVSH